LCVSIRRAQLGVKWERDLIYFLVNLQGVRVPCNVPKAAPECVVIDRIDKQKLFPAIGGHFATEFRGCDFQLHGQNAGIANPGFH
jgi:hypothetical protein